MVKRRPRQWPSFGSGRARLLHLLRTTRLAAPGGGMLPRSAPEEASRSQWAARPCLRCSCDPSRLPTPLSHLAEVPPF